MTRHPACGSGRQRSPFGRALALALAIAAGACGDAQARYLSIATAGTGGVYYPLGGAIANLLSAADSSRRVTAEVTGGSVENVNRLRAGGVDLAMAIGTTVHEAYTGGTDFPDPHSELRVVAPLYPNLTHVVVRANSRIRSVADMRGARVSVGAPGSGTEQVAMHVLAAYGIAPTDVQLRFLSFNESSAALRDGAIDAAILSVGYPASAVLEATTTGDARLIPIDGAAATRLTEAHAYYTEARIPAGAYRGLDADLPTVAVMNWVVANASLDAAVVADLLAILRDRRDALIQVHDIARQIDLATLARAPIPLHAETERWLGANPTPRN